MQLPSPSWLVFPLSKRHDLRRIIRLTSSPEVQLVGLDGLSCPHKGAFLVPKHLASTGAGSDLCTQQRVETNSVHSWGFLTTGLIFLMVRIRALMMLSPNRRGGDMQATRYHKEWQKFRGSSDMVQRWLQNQTLLQRRLVKVTWPSLASLLHYMYYAQTN